MDIEEWLEGIRNKHRKGKKVHSQEFEDQPDIFILPMIISGLLFMPIMFLALRFTGTTNWLSSIFFLLYLALGIYGYHTILGYING
jgi:hypothetical protein